MVDIKRAPSDPDYASLHVPAWVPKVYPVLAIVLLPWTIYLGLSLPEHHLSAHWDVSWVGLDIGLILGLSATGLLAYLHSVWVTITATTTGSLLLVDAWFDVMSERRPSDFHQALFLAIVVELPLSALSYYVASHVLYHNTVLHKR